MGEFFKLTVPINLPFQEGDRTVVNLSRHHKLTAAQSALLGSGLNFIPTKGVNTKAIEQSRFYLQDYHRKLKLAAYFEHSNESERLRSLINQSGRLQGH